MKSRRRTSIILLMAASVFLCLVMSCGIPTYLVPTVTFTKNSSNPSQFLVSYKGDGVGDSGKVGLLLLYYLDTAQVDTSDDSKIRNKFTSTYKVTTYDGVVVSPEDDQPLYDFSNSSGETCYVYAFELDNVPVVAPEYTLPMSTVGDFTAVINFEIIDEDIRMYVDGVMQEIPISIHENIHLMDTKYINVYAALSVQSSRYSNLFWSNLSNVGYIWVE